MNKQNMTGKAPNHGPGIVSRLALCGLIVAGAGMVSWTQAAEEAKPTVIVGLSQLNSEIAFLRSSLGSTVGALEEVKAAAGKNGELTKPYATYSDSVATLEAQVVKLRERGMALKARAKDHWTAWEAELNAMQNPKLREKAQRRYSDTVKEFQKIVEKVEDAKAVFAPLMADLKDVNTYLKTDLSKDAVSSLSGTIWNMNKTARSADSKLGQVNEQIARVIAKMPQS